MDDFLIIELLHVIFVFLVPFYMIIGCSCNDRDREQMHLERRQALRERQREAAISGRSVRSVIETEIETDTSQCPRITCVQRAPRLKTHSGVNTADVYERLSQGDSSMRKLEKEKPPNVQLPALKSERPRDGSKEGSSEEYPDERDKLSAEKAEKDKTEKDTH